MALAPKRIHEFDEYPDRLLESTSVFEVERECAADSWVNEKKSAGELFIIDQVSGTIDAPEARDYSLILDCPYLIKVRKITARCVVAGLDLVILLNSTVITGTAITVNADGVEFTGTASLNFTGSEGVELIMRASAISGTPEILDFTVEFERAITKQ